MTLNTTLKHSVVFFGMLLFFSSFAFARKHVKPVAALVFSTFQPISGQEPDFFSALDQNVPTLRMQGYASERSTVRFLSSSGGVVEIFEWLSPKAIDQAHLDPVVQKIWTQISENNGVASIVSTFPEANSLRPIFLPGDGGATRIAVELYHALPNEVGNMIQKLNEYLLILHNEGFTSSCPALVMQSFTDVKYLPIVFEWISTTAPNAAGKNSVVQNIRAELDEISDLESMSSFVDYQERFPSFKSIAAGGVIIPASSTWTIIILVIMTIVLGTILLRRRGITKFNERRRYV